MACPICGAKCVCRKRGEDGRCCPCHKHKSRTPAQAAAHAEHDREHAATPVLDLMAALKASLAGDLRAELYVEQVERRDGFTYLGLFDRPVVTDLLIINDGSCRVVVATERADNPGASITNTIEKLAAALSHETHWLIGDFILVEHYPPRGDLERSVDRVHFERMWSGVTWTHLGIEGLKALIAPAAAALPV